MSVEQRIQESILQSRKCAFRDRIDWPPLIFNDN